MKKLTPEERIMQIFRENIAARRESDNLSQSKLSKLSGKGQSYICDHERARRPGATIATLAKIAVYGFGLDVEEAYKLLKPKK